MRRLAVLVAVLGLSLSSRAWADPFANLSRSLEHYDQQSEGRRPVSQASAQQPVRGRPSGVRQASGIPMKGRPMAQQAAMREEVQPAPMPREHFEPQTDSYYPGEVWEEPMGGNCADGSCGLGCGWCRPGFWGRAEYLAWWTRGAYVPPLVTTSPDGTPVGQAGVLPNADILFGDERINENGRSGGRFTLGYWFDPANTLGIENTFFFIGEENEGFASSSSGSPILARPFFNTESGEQDSLLIAFPQVVVGGINITSDRSIYSNEINLRRALYSDCCRRVDVLAGYRYFRLAENLDITSNTTALDSAQLGTQFAVQDRFGTGNNFNGGQLGVNLQFTRGYWTWDLLGKLALGGVSQRANINGQTVTTAPGEDPIIREGGVLALASNSGRHDQTVFGVLPEFDINLRYQWSPLWRVNVGYTFMALTNVLRPGDQIDLNIDPAQFPPGVAGTFPEFNFNESDIWLQGINVGLECNF